MVAIPEEPARRRSPGIIDLALGASAVLLVAFFAYGLFPRHAATPRAAVPAASSARSAPDSGGAPTAQTPLAPGGPRREDPGAAGDGPSQEVAPQLQLVGLRCGKDNGDHVIEGAVRNIG
ncbi:MAG TPA: hypothetical protein VEL75_05565, partial [Candidatus Methylomirabilis sp.]|nr:hypothetical protein [Candidatus Methylomirabilis sp.]